MVRKSMTERLKDNIKKAAGRWDKENKTFEQLVKEKMEEDDQLRIAMEEVSEFDDFMLTIYFNDYDDKNLSNRIKKFVKAYGDFIGGGNIYSSSCLGGYLYETFDADFDEFSMSDMSFMAGEETLSEYIVEYLEEYNSNLGQEIETIINTIKGIDVTDDIQKAQKRIILQNIQSKGQKLIKTYNDFKMLVDAELSSSDTDGMSLPFVYVKNTKTGKPVNSEGKDAKNIKEVVTFDNDDDAIVLVDKGGIDFVSVDCKNAKDFRELLDSLRR